MIFEKTLMTLAAAVFAMRNPALLAAVIKAFLDPKPGPPPKA